RTAANDRGRTSGTSSEAARIEAIIADNHGVRLSLSATMASSLPILLAASAAFVVSLVVAGVVRRWMLSRGVVVAPRPDRWHRQPTPTYGGIGILCGLLAGAAAAGGLAPDAWPVIAASLTLFVIGLFDDL